VIAVVAFASGTSVVSAFMSPASAGTAAGAKTVALQADDFRFCDPAAIQCLPTDSGNVTTVAAGTTVTWTYRDFECDVVVPCPGHNVRFGSTGGKTIKMEGALLYKRKFLRPGRYTYECSIHAAFGMTGVIVVTGKAAGAGTSAAPASSTTTTEAPSPPNPYPYPPY
jgi:plastocyanin